MLLGVSSQRGGERWSRVNCVSPLADARTDMLGTEKDTVLHTLKRPDSSDSTVKILKQRKNPEKLLRVCITWPPRAQQRGFRPGGCSYRPSTRYPLRGKT